MVFEFSGQAAVDLRFERLAGVWNRIRNSQFRLYRREAALQIRAVVRIDGKGRFRGTRRRTAPEVKFSAEAGAPSLSKGLRGISVLAT